MLKDIENVNTCANNAIHAKILTRILLGKVIDSRSCINCCLAKFKIIKTLLDSCVNLWKK